jgi:hypothetical protein
MVKEKGKDEFRELAFYQRRQAEYGRNIAHDSKSE